MGCVLFKTRSSIGKLNLAEWIRSTLMLISHLQLHQHTNVAVTSLFSLTQVDYLQLRSALRRSSEPAESLTDQLESQAPSTGGPGLYINKCFRRLLWFTKQEIFFGYREGWTSEEIPEAGKHDRDDSGSYDRLFVAVQDDAGHSLLVGNEAILWFSKWRRVLERYSSRLLTNRSDRLPALSGLAKRIQALTGSEYAAGLWCRDLLRELLWWKDLSLVEIRQPEIPLENEWKESKAHQKRFLSQISRLLGSNTHKTVSPGESTIGVPSWSWIAMDEAVTYLLE